MKLKNYVSLALVPVLLSPIAAFAFVFDDGTAAAPPSINNDYYTAAENVLLNSSVNGDMTAAGGTVYINAPVSQDLALVGGNLSINSEIGDDARIAGGDLQINSLIKGDLIAGGGNITLGKNAFVGGDLVFGSGNVRIDGTVNGNVLGVAKTVWINGEIKGNVRLVNVESLRFGPMGKVMGNLNYHSAQSSPDATPETVKGQITYSATQVPVDQRDMGGIALGLLAGFSLFGLLSLLFAGLFFLWMLRYLMIHAAETATTQSLPSLGFGFLAVFLTPILSLIFLVTGIGLPMGLMLFLAWCLLLFIGKLVGVLIVGLRLVDADVKTPFPRLFWAFTVGALLYTVIGMIPILGWILRFLLTLMGIGAFLLYQSELFQSNHKKKLI
ncbi:polymer-forming cytoskeletal protein [Candidatus Peregrinibacteria bacterium]|nr:polymer-forming cytoskeletal protein [Candidatus Peregrinibacteria bacterium]